MLSLCVLLLVGDMIRPGFSDDGLSFSAGIDPAP